MYSTGSRGRRRSHLPVKAGCPNQDQRQKNSKGIRNLPPLLLSTPGPSQPGRGVRRRERKQRESIASSPSSPSSLSLTPVPFPQRPVLHALKVMNWKSEVRSTIEPCGAAVVWLPAVVLPQAIPAQVVGGVHAHTQTDREVKTRRREPKRIPTIPSCNSPKQPIWLAAGRSVQF